MPSTARFCRPNLLARCLKTGVRPKHLVLVTPIVWPPTGTGTRDGPMRALEDAARRIEKEVPGVLAVNVVGGYAFSDVPYAGVAFSIITEGSDEDGASGLAANWRRSPGTCARAAFPSSTTWTRWCAISGPVGGKGPVLLVEPADNIGGGAPGDGTDVMRALLKYDIQGAGVAIADPESGGGAADVPIGGKITLPIGGKGSPLDPGPVTLEVELVSRSDGVFELEDKNSHLVGSLGKIIHMGPSAVVKHRGLTILLTSKKLPPFDLGQWRSQGINPEELSMIGIKAAVGHRVAYGKIAVGRIHGEHLRSLHLRHHPAALHQAAAAGVSAGPRWRADMLDRRAMLGGGGVRPFRREAWAQYRQQPRHQRHDDGRSGDLCAIRCSTPG